MPNSKNILTPQQKLFCDKYVANKFNGKQAAISAGYSKNGAEVNASKLLTYNKVKDYIAKITQKHYDLAKSNLKACIENKLRYETDLLQELS